MFLNFDLRFNFTVISCIPLLCQDRTYVWEISFLNLALPQNFPFISYFLRFHFGVKWRNLISSLAQLFTTLNVMGSFSLFLTLPWIFPMENVSRESPVHTAVSRKVVGRNAHATIPKGNMGYDQYTVRNDWSCRNYFCCFPLVLANICPWPPVPFFQISLKKSALKATHNTFRDCRVDFFRQPFSK